ncbi:Voldacs domain-containing protein [Plasmodium brasilianum]|uniref:Uncharacterized protein n=2 Tax=Plasmodium (Plasmodium) TaxID=418103 RepID=A0A1A8WPG4_PLAMA|nr:conserved Plasmodium protein, unknown function [Plasmodium malariae]KAI4836438.1 Voldacs domain-containing protein [Plasmodium brasilianum]SBS94777.1 conserved Plasmodium protein, unknown function [Plasmodium malariae]SCO93713.1 conserved Plasmodium protein, unknown function [Plasmodium malariae]
MAVSLNTLNEEDLKAMENGGADPVLYKGNDIEFVYNKLNLGGGKLFILEKKVIWVRNKNEYKKEKVTSFKELSTNKIYLKHYEKNKNFYLHLLNDVNSISIDSSNIALHAITSDKNICNSSCVYIQLNSDLSSTFQNDKNDDDDDDEQNSLKSDNENTKSDEDTNILNDETITPEILLVSKNNSSNDEIFRQLSNMDNSFKEQDDDEEDDEGE